MFLELSGKVDTNLTLYKPLNLYEKKQLNFVEMQLILYRVVTKLKHVSENHNQKTRSFYDLTP